MQNDIYDIAIIGLGPSGSTLARLLNNKYKVVALDKCGETNLGFTKPCGGLLAPDAQKALAEFNLTLPKSILVDPQIFSVKTIDIDANITRHYQRFYLNLDRFEFDKWLRSLIPKSVDVFLGSKCLSIARQESSAGSIFMVNFIDCNGARLTIFAKIIVGADGANSIVRRTLLSNSKAQKNKIRFRTSIQQWFTDVSLTPFYSCIFDSETTDTYAWALTKGSYFIFGGAFNPKNAKADFEKLKLKLIEKGFKLDNPIKTEACQVTYSNNKFFLGASNAFLIGEAAGFVSPSSYEGISYALQSSKILANVLNCEIKTTAHNKIYYKKTNKLRQKIRSKSLKAKIIYSPFLRKLILKSKISSINTD